MSKKNQSAADDVANQFAEGEERLVAPALDPKFFEGMEKFATGAVGFARVDEDDSICGILLGQHAKLECAYVELEHPCVVNNGKTAESGLRKEWMASVGDVVNVNFHYATGPVLADPDCVGQRVIITVGKEEPIGKGKTLKAFDVRLPKGGPRPKLATKNGASAALPVPSSMAASERALGVFPYGAASPLDRGGASSFCGEASSASPRLARIGSRSEKERDRDRNRDGPLT